MQIQRFKIGTMPILLATLILACSSGCGSVPWRKKETTQSAEYQAYLDQAVTNPAYSRSYRTSAVDGQTLPPPIISPSDQVAETSGGCNDGCCH
ncbi:MAG: hypothetical protein CMJ58_04425 [Planctomycetaceae bacterium]|nr:hypothetical protein [Planctomycetaceae bacterium]